MSEKIIWAYAGGQACLNTEIKEKSGAMSKK